MSEGLKLPLRVVPGLIDRGGWVLVDADYNQLEITERRAELIVAALEADAEKEKLRTLKRACGQPDWQTILLGEGDEG